MTTTTDTPATTGPGDETNLPAETTSTALSIVATSNGAQSPSEFEAAMMDPSDLVIAENVRRTFDLDDHPEYTASIGEHGVLSPIRADRMPDGSIEVRDGQLRTLIAVEIGLARVPVWINTAVDPRTAESEITRISEQITVNDRRIPLTDGDRAAGIAKMLDFGASLTRVARELQTDREEVKLAGRIGQSETACRSVDDEQLDFEQAAILAEYDVVGDTDAVQHLLNTPHSMFAYEARRIANRREERRALLQTSLPYAAAGFTILTEDPDTDGTDATFIPADRLFTSDDQPVGLAQIQAEPERWAVYCDLLDDVATIDRETREPVDPETVDWTTERYPDTSPDEGLRHAREVERRDLWDAIYYLPVDQLDATGLHESVVTPESSDTVSDAADPAQFVALDAVDADADPEAFERARVAEQQRTEARARAAEELRQRQLAEDRANELDKLGKAAMEARREFITKLVSRKNEPPQQSSMFVLQSVINDPGLFDSHDATVIALDLLGIKGWRPELLSSLENARPPRCRVVVLALVLAGYELRTGKKAWRYNDVRVQRYLRFLAEVGHNLTPIEQVAIGDLDADTIEI
ncbi:ParB/RepB/Spo0J family partition protein [Nocardia sp. NPDC049149]|uniref:ParB/RepB/Spo0J family partition protein n=1 Tax=Nocardia sp. NPDC049149 TaxID=3364315 RepID=UPI0037140ED4